MTEKLYFTRKGFIDFQERIEKEKGKLKKLYSCLSELVEAGSGCHDNFSFEQQTREIHQLNDKIMKDERILLSAVIIENTKNTSYITLDANVLIEKNGVEEWWKVVGFSESEPEYRRVAYNTPFGKSLMRKRVGDEFMVKLGKTNVYIKIKQIRR